MSKRDLTFYGYDHHKDFAKSLKGRLIVIEGSDGVGRSSQISLLHEYLENKGYGVVTSGQKRGKLTGKGLKAAMRGHTLGDTTLNIFYATDFADRLEREILPSLRAGFVVITDRYIFSPMVRGIVRGADPQWIKNLFSFALIPDKIIYLRANVKTLAGRVISQRGFNYWESGKDVLSNRDYYESFIEYQNRMLAQYDAIAHEYEFEVVDANRGMHEVFQDILEHIDPVISTMKIMKKPIPDINA